MSRTLTTGFIGASESEHFDAAHLIEFAFDGGASYVTDAGHDVPWNGNNYIGAGNVVGMDVIRETSTNEVLAVKLSLAGPVSAYRSLALAEHSHGRLCTIRIAMFADGVVIADPTVEHIGRLGAISMVDELTDNGDVRSVISVSSESKHAGARKPKNRRHALEDHQIDHSTDTIHRFMPALQEKALVWPSKAFFERT
jgi:hypothetical protein